MPFVHAVESHGMSLARYQIREYDERSAGGWLLVYVVDNWARLGPLTKSVKTYKARTEKGAKIARRNAVKERDRLNGFRGE